MKIIILYIISLIPLGYLIYIAIREYVETQKRISTYKKNHFDD